MNIDFHAHFLPKADHGSDGLKTSLRQVALAQEAGIDILTATPHFYPMQDTAEAFLQRREQCYAELKANLPAASPRIILGAEVQLCRGLENVAQIEQLCLEGTRVLLLELPPAFHYKTYARTLEALRYERDLTVVLAHIDRYATSVTETLLSEGFLAQINASALCRFLQKKKALRWAKGGSVVALGSDLHGTSVGYTQFLTAKERLGSLYAKIMRETEALVSPISL